MEEQKHIRQKLELLKGTEGFKEYLDILKNLYKALLKTLAHTRLLTDDSIKKAAYLQAQVELIESIIPITWEEIEQEVADEQLNENLTI